MSSPSKRALGLWMCTALVMGNMIGSGIFLLPSALAPYGGLSLIGWGITATGAFLLALIFARLSRMLPRAGGPYAYTRAGFGDFAAFWVAWGYWISILATNAAIAVAFVSYLTVFWAAPASNPVLAAGLALITLWLLTGVNALGVQHGGRVQVVSTVLKVIPLAAVALFGLLYFNPNHLIPSNISGQSDLSAVTATVALTLWAFLGLESATIPADHIKDPARTIPRATLIGTLATAVLYILGTVAVMGIVPPLSLAGSTAPFADAARTVWGPWAAYGIGLGAAIACFGALNGWILLQAQIPKAAAQDGLFPQVFNRTAANGIPLPGLLISSSLVTVLMLLNYTKGLVELFTFIILLATLTCLIPYVFSTMAYALLVWREPAQADGRTVWKETALAGVAFTYAVGAIAGAGQEIVYWGFLALVAGLPVYAVSVRGSIKQKRATE